jgi:tetratricopeptide (TPR) repeat protein
MQKGKIDQALRDLNQAIELNPEDSDLFILLGDVYFIIGKKENCISSYKKALKLNPNSETPLIKLAETYLILKDYEEAKKYIDFALSNDVNNQKAYYLKGVGLMETGDTTEALINLKIAGNLDSTYYEAFMQTGTIYTAKNDNQAIDYYKAALKARPDDERALLLLALSYQYNDNFDKSIRIYKYINQLYPDNKTAYFNTGSIYMIEKHDFDSAVDAFREAINIDPSYVEAVYNLGRIYEERGDYQAAGNQYRQALELKTNYPLAIEGLNRLDAIRSN